MLSVKDFIQIICGYLFPLDRANFTFTIANESRLTYMSIRDEVLARVNEERLIEIRPLSGSLATPRSVFATPEVFKQLDPETADDDLSAEAGRLRRKLDDFVSGKRFTVGGRKVKECDIKKLDPASMEVWEVRETVDPSIRIFGRFAEQDCLITTNVRSVYDLFSEIWGKIWPVWRSEIRLCKAKWRALFYTYLPHSGETVHEYLSNVIERRA
jgi:hypothetical protein